MNDDMKMALGIGVVGLIIMIAASIALWFFHMSEIGCSIVMAVGVIIVIVAIIYASFPQYFDRFKKKEAQTAVSDDVPEEAETSAQTEEAPAENNEAPKE